MMTASRSKVGSWPVGGYHQDSVAATPWCRMLYLENISSFALLFIPGVSPVGLRTRDDTI